MGKFFVALVTYSLLFFGNISFSQFQNSKLSEKFYENGQPTPTGVDVGMFANTPTRIKIDLSGYWQYTIDDKQWLNIQIPSAYNFESRITFQRKFEITSEMIDKFNFILVAYGINNQSEIQINGNFVGRHIGGYSSFVLPIRENILQVGRENAIRITTDNELTATSTLPLRQQVSGWRNYGGIFRDIYILATPKLYINETIVTSELSPDYKNAKLKISATVENAGFDFSAEEKTKNNFSAISVEVYDKLTEALVGRSALVPLDVPKRKAKEFKIELQIANPKLWSPEVPDLYLVKCTIVRVEGKETFPIDEYILNYGLRNLQLKNSSIVLNGNPFYVKGVIYFEEHPFFGSALTYSEMEKDIAKIKSGGINLIRFLYPPHPYFLNLCDRYGIFVIEEIPLTNVPAAILEKEFYIDLASTYVRDMIWRDRNNTSVLAWGIGNEFEISKKNPSIAVNYIESMKKIIALLDSRPVYVSVMVNWDISDIIEKVDIVSINTYSGFESSINQLRSDLSTWRQNYPDKPIIIGKYGKEILPNNRSGYSDPTSIESQAWYAWQANNVIRELKFAGSVFWSYNDWFSDRPSMATPSGNPYLRSTGMVNMARDRRVVYDVLRSVFNNEKVSALPVGNYSSSAPIIFVIVGLVVLISLAFFYNSNRRFRENMNRSILRTYNFFADVRDQRIIPVSHSIFLSAVLSITFAIILSSILSHYRYNLLVDNLLSQILSDTMKNWLVQLVWYPLLFIAYFSVIIFLKILLLTLIVKFFSLFIRVRVYLYHAFSVLVWSLTPMIIFIPLSMVLFRIMEDPIYILPSLGVILLILIISVFRLFKGVSIIFDIAPSKIYVAGVFAILVVAGLLYGYLDYSYSTTIYLKYLVNVFI